MAIGSRPLSLKARAIALLALRDHSKSELRRKLVRIARQMRARIAEMGTVSTDAQADRSVVCSAQSDQADIKADQEIDELLAWLELHGFLNEARFAESRIHTRAARYGNLRIQQELALHGMRLDAQAQAELKSSELQRARDVWRRKFGAIVAQDPSERSKQMRFLAARGFSAESIRRVLRDSDED